MDRQQQTLLGGLRADAFMQRIWQRKPWLVRGAWAQPAFIDRASLFALAAREDVESRLITQTGRRWALTHGPIKRRAMPALSQRAWTLLVQGVDLHLDAAHGLLRRFDFVPWARLDDVMVSFATDGGGVGPHTDDYDVFLLQVQGKRRWQVGPVDHARWRTHTPLKQLKGFAPTDSWTLDAGDMLYVPPGWGHHGTAVGSCITASIGFRAPRAGELARDLMARMVDDDDERIGAPTSLRYRDAARHASTRPGEIPAAMTRFAVQSVTAAMRTDDALALALGEWLTEPKPLVIFDREAAPQPRAMRADIVLDRRTRMLYDARFVFINGESFEVSGTDADRLHALADARSMQRGDWQSMSASARNAVGTWMAAGWLHRVPMASAAPNQSNRRST